MYANLFNIVKNKIITNERKFEIPKTISYS